MCRTGHDQGVEPAALPAENLLVGVDCDATVDRYLTLGPVHASCPNEQTELTVSQALTVNAANDCRSSVAAIRPLPPCDDTIDGGCCATSRLAARPSLLPLLALGLLMVRRRVRR